MILLAVFFIIGVATQAAGQRRQAVADMMPGNEAKYMQYTDQWKKEIVAWSKDLIHEISYKVSQTEQLIWELNSDLRYQLGVTMGRIYELHRQQIDMYRRMKRRIDNKFNWIQSDLAHNYKNKDGSSFIDYKAHMYIVALEFITKRESDIEHLVKLIDTYLGEEEVGRFKPHMLPASEDIVKAWTKFTTSRVAQSGGFWGRQGPEYDTWMERKQEHFKAKMRADYYNKRRSNDEIIM